ncbi:tRNA (guanine(9)-N(1))-methyltransferase [Sporothrix bragantina]|uniref:tRNA (guanine(9)-N1)-methyltransferase n=1 Tax=Sporothrix bragantina TaxID=671064 RepID=A0ABP0BTH3_9PEZI
MDTTQDPEVLEAVLPTEASSAAGAAQQLTPESNEAQVLDHTTTSDAPRPDAENGDDEGIEAAGTHLAVAGAAGTPGTPGTPLSKNAQKKLKRQQKWEDMRDDRKRRRKEKRIVKQEKKRAAKSEAGEGGQETAVVPTGPKEHTLVPVSLIFDCDFESLMRETELISLASQITRSYAANRTATRCTRIYVSSWGGKLQTRYETLLSNQHKRWNHVSFLADDFVAAAKQADTDMRGEDGGAIVDVLKGEDGVEAVTRPEPEPGAEAEADVETPAEEGVPNVVYLTSDSPNTLTRLEPYTSYVIGGIVDKNREKGLCYGRAKTRGIRTAKLPIGDYMVMASRQVLTTNHVVEIMLSWLETGDWAVAFDNVIPKRKGGQLKGQEGKDDEGKAEDGAEDEGEGEVEEHEKEKKGADDSAMDLQDDVKAAPEAEAAA